MIAEEKFGWSALNIKLCSTIIFLTSIYLLFHAAHHQCIHTSWESFCRGIISEKISETLQEIIFNSTSMSCDTSFFFLKNPWLQLQKQPESSVKHCLNKSSCVRTLLKSFWFHVESSDHRRSYLTRHSMTTFRQLTVYDSLWPFHKGLIWPSQSTSVRSTYVVVTRG